MPDFLRRRPTGFTLIELLVVITIITLLMSLLLPSFKSAKLLSNAIKCGAVQKSLFVAMDSYATSNREYPTNYNRTSGTSGNWGDECATAMSGAPPTTQTIGTVTVNPLITPSPYGGANMSAVERLFYNGDLQGYGYNNTGIWMKSAAINCTGELPKNFVPRPTGNANNKIFTYNGPSTPAGSVVNNGNNGGMTIIGRHYIWRASSNSYIGTGGEAWGISYKYAPTASKPSDIGFLGCPSFISTLDSTLVMEPHGNGELSGAGAQYDNPNAATYIDMTFNRNYTFGDGHVRYIVRASRMGWLY